MADPFLSLLQFQALWDGPTLNTAQEGVAQLLLDVATGWITTHAPAIAAGDSAGKLVTYEVVANALRYGKYAPLKEWSRTTMHKMDSGTLDDPSSALDFTDRHKQLLGIPLRGIPLGNFAVNDFDDQNYGNPELGRYPYYYGNGFGHCP